MPTCHNGLFYTMKGSAQNVCTLINYLSKHRQIGSLLFPRTAEKAVDAETVKARIKEEGELDISEQQAKCFLLQYIDELGRRDPQR